MKKPPAILLHRILPALACVLMLSGCAGIQSHARPAPVPDIAAGFPAGYLPPDLLPNSLALLNPPPAEDSPAFALDRKIAAEALTLRGTPRWKLAVEDANLKFPRAAGAFACAVQVRISEKETPRLYTLLRRTMTDAGFSAYSAQNHYKRPRPFIVNREPSCTPDEENFLSQYGSYPSGHTSIGWAWALILAEIAPGRTNEILGRGRAFGESRIICGVHWRSDVNAGFLVGAGVVARLHADPVFQADLEAAKAELAAARAKGIPPLRDCAAERAALSFKLFPDGK
ncbi:MAG TPA: phosphatase PAP2 family protein [Syntrophales bacterium]|nr:phosphatase PAP2 family protein [Syntrophales bacterium]